MKNIFNIHPLTIISLLITLMTGYFKETFIIMTIILIHELGHIIASLIFKWKIEKIVVLPFGAITFFNILINVPLIEEFIVAIMGPIFQIIFTLVLNNKTISFYSYIILIINLFPIYPLDGSKILYVLINKIFSFKMSHKLIIYISYFIVSFLLFLMILDKNIIMILFLLFLLFKLKDEINNHNLIFNKFLYERYLYDFDFKRVKIVSKVDKFKKDYYHFIRDNTKYIDEKKYLINLFK